MSEGGIGARINLLEEDKKQDKMNRSQISKILYKNVSKIPKILIHHAQNY